MTTGDRAAVLLVLRARPDALTAARVAELSGTPTDSAGAVLEQLAADRLVHRFPFATWGAL